MVHFTRENGAHRARNAVDDVAARGRRLALLHEFIHAGGEDALLHPGGIARAVGGLEELRELGAGPEARLEVVRLARGAGNRKEFAEDHGPARKREHDQDGENDLHHNARIGNEREDRKIGSSVHLRKNECKKEKGNQFAGASASSRSRQMRS